MPYSTLVATLLPDANTNYSQFGSCVSLKAPYLAIGAPGAEPSVYIFQRNSSGTWVRNARILVPSFASEPDQISLSQDGRHLVVSAFFDNAVYVYTRPSNTSSTWTRVATLTPPNNVNLFGLGVDIFGSSGEPYRIAVGASEAVVMFRGSGATWSVEQLLQTPQTGGGFGGSLAGFGSKLVVGASAAGSLKGEAYFWRRSGSSWNMVKKVVAPDGATPHQFGLAVAIDTNGALIGAPGYNQNVGKGYVFKENGQDNWVLNAELYSNDMALSNGYAGSSVGLGPRCAVLGAPNFSGFGQPNTNTGAYFFSTYSTSWSAIEGELPPVFEFNEYFGKAVDASTDNLNANQNIAAVGTPGRDANGNDTGAVYIFTVTP